MSVQSETSDRLKSLSELLAGDSLLSYDSLKNVASELNRMLSSADSPADYSPSLKLRINSLELIFESKKMLYGGKQDLTQIRADREKLLKIILELNRQQQAIKT